jgi:hypothetical protein
LTIDTECLRGNWPAKAGSRPSGYEEAMIGRVDGKEYGIRFIMDALEQHGLVGDFFVEPLCSHVLGIPPLRDLCQEVLARGHGVSLHLHPGWKSVQPHGRHVPVVGGSWSDMLCDYPVEVQESLVREGMDLLGKCGVERISAFRAGNLGADFRIYGVLQRVGIPISSNYCGGWNGDIAKRFRLPASTNHEVRMEGIWEIPVTCFHDFPCLRPHHRRPLQIAAASVNELETVFESALRQGTRFIVVLFHTFEWIRGLRAGRASLNRGYLHRFHALCRLLADRVDQVVTGRFEDLNRDGVLAVTAERESAPRVIRSNDHAGAMRLSSHILARLAGWR